MIIVLLFSTGISPAIFNQIIVSDRECVSAIHICTSQTNRPLLSAYSQMLAYYEDYCRLAVLLFVGFVELNNSRFYQRIIYSKIDEPPRATNNVLRPSGKNLFDI